MTRRQARSRPIRCNPKLAALLAVGLVVSACTADDPAPSTLPSAAPTEAPPGGASDPVETPCLSLNPEFTDQGTTSVLGGTRPDARQLAGIDWITTDDCERIVFSFVTVRGAPASQIGLSRLEFAPEQGILRVEMPRDVDATAVADSLVDGRFVERAFVIRARSGNLLVDLHFAVDEAVEARGIIIGAPARLVVDLRRAPGGDRIGTSPPTIAPDVVVLSPAPGTAGYPLRVRGYARTAQDIVTTNLVSGSVPIERRVTAAPSADAWGEFAVTISEGPPGDVTLLVASDLSRPDSDEAAEIPLTIP